MSPALKQPTLKQLRHFVATAQTGQVSRAAARCFVSQPSLTISLRNLEEALEVQLFTRHADGLRLTLQGETFLRHADHILRTLGAAMEETRSSVSTVPGRLRIPITPTISQYLLPKILAALGRQLPNIELEFIEQEREEIDRGLERGDNDFAVLLVSNIDETAAVRCETLAQSPRKLWTSVDHPLSNRRSVTLAEIEAFPFVLLDMDDHIRTVQRYWSAHGLQPRVVFQTKSIEAARSLVAQNLGVTILSDLVYRPWSHDGGRVRRTIIHDSVPSMDIGLAYRRHAPVTAAMQAFVTVLRLHASTVEPDLELEI